MGQEEREEHKEKEKSKGEKKESEERREEEKRKDGGIQAKVREWRERHFAGMEHQTRIASPAKRPKIWGDFNSIWATEEFKTVHGPNLNPEWITWNESEFSGPSIKVKEEKY